MTFPWTAVSAWFLFFPNELWCNQRWIALVWPLPGGTACHAAKSVGRAVRRAWSSVHDATMKT
jgi:hypothetical protein